MRSQGVMNGRLAGSRSSVSTKSMSLCMGVWLGGFLYDRTGSYDIVWYIAIALGVFAALVNLPVREAPIARAMPQGA